MPIQENIDGNWQSHIEAIKLLRIYHLRNYLLLYLEEDIMAELNIVGYTNQAMAEEADENARAYLQKFEKFHGPLEDDPGVIYQKFGEMRIKKIRFTGEGLPLFPKSSSSTIT